MILNMMTRILKVSGKYKKQIQIAFIFSVLNAVLAKMPILYAMIIISKLYYGTMTSLHYICRHSNGYNHHFANDFSTCK